MPSFEVLIMGASLGFMPGCAKLNAAAADAEVCSQILDGAVKAHKSGSSVTVGDYCEEIKVLSYILYSREQAQPRPALTEVAAVLDSNTILTRESITAFCAGLDTILPPSSPSSSQQQQQTVEGEVSSSLEATVRKSGGQLFNFQWRLGVAISSSACKALSSPYVAVTFSVRDSNGEVTCHSAEMSFSEFQDFHRVFKEVGELMDAF